MDGRHFNGDLLIVSCSFENDRYLNSLSPEVSMHYAVDAVDIEQYEFVL